MTNHIASLGTDMLTKLISCSVVRKRCTDSMAIHIASLGTDMPTNFISCSIVHRNARIGDNSHYKPWHRYGYIAV